MGLNRYSLAAALVMIIGAPLSHAQPAPQPEAPTVSADPALDSSPIAGSEATTQAAPADAMASPAPEMAPTTAPAETAEPVVHPADVMEPPAESGKGDTLAMPKKAPSAKKSATSMPIKMEVDGMPGRGISMTQVEKRFGQPQEKLPAVGNPPITRWIYGDYTVYFEHEYVVHSVSNEAKATNAPAPAEAAPAMAPAVTDETAEQPAPAPAEPAAGAQ